MTSALLTLTRRYRQDLTFLPRPELYFPPFDRVTSRLRYRPDLFRFARRHETIDELVKMKKTAPSWSECCFKRADEILKLGKRRYYVSYSGGIDSTALLCAIFQVWPAKELRRLRIVMSHHSIIENPTFFERYLVGLKLIPYVARHLLMPALLEQNSLFVTGELADQLFGSDMLMAAVSLFGDEALHKKYEDCAIRTLDYLLRRKGEKLGRVLFEHLCPITEECPFPIKTTHDFFWWFNFTQKWQNVKFRFLESRDWDLRARYEEHVINFYDTIDFQLWSLQNHDQKIGNTWDTYKQVSKNFIYAFTKDPEHLRMKKIQSLVKTYFLMERRTGVSADLPGHLQEVRDRESLKEFVRYGI